MNENIYKCDQCGRIISKTNYYGIKIDNKVIHVCGKHYGQYKKYHKFLDNNPENQNTRNKYKITQEGVWIYCTNRQGINTGKFLIDEADLEEVIKHKWRFSRGNYCTGNTKVIQIHTFLMHPDNNQVVDHINGNREDNRRSNLRITTQAKNCINKNIPSNNISGVMGVTWDKERKKWTSEIKVNYQKCYLGRYDKFEDAVYARYISEIILFDKFRSFRNDEKILDIIEKCENKDQIDTYIANRIIQKGLLDTNLASDNQYAEKIC